ncbi:MAG: hypothetical protein CMM99_02150 [Rickettsiales bacterium]|nr:hypothetical protein [Rickettsiales bacterium]
MISFLKACQIIKKEIKPSSKTEFIDLDNSYKRILARNILSKFDSPQNNLSSMDGAVINSKSLPNKEYEIIGESKAGDKFSSDFNYKQTKLIYTGAPVPKGKKIVIPKENFLINKEKKILIIKSFPKTNFIRTKGKDFRKNQICLYKNDILNLRSLALAKNLKEKKLLVKKKPKVFAVITGDEIISKNNPKGLIESSNEIFIRHYSEIFGYELKKVVTVRDNIKELKKTLESTNDYDFLMTCGGISKGKYDLVKETLKDYGLKVFFDKLKIKPGKPTTFGKLSSNRYFLGVPGNPISCFISILFIFSKMINSFYGFKLINFSKRKLESNSSITISNNLTNFLRIKLSSLNSNNFNVLNDQDSSLQMKLKDSDGILVLSSQINNIKKGNEYEVILFKDLPFC